MVQTDDDDFLLHGLLKPASMPAGENRIAPEEITEHDAETDHGQERRLFAAQPGCDPPMQNRAVKKPGDTRRDLPRLPGPIIAPMNARPQAAGEDAEGHQGEAPNQEQKVETVEGFQRR